MIDPIAALTHKTVKTVRNYLPTEVIQTTPNGIELLHMALVAYEQNGAEAWDLGLLHELKKQLESKLMPV